MVRAQGVRAILTSVGFTATDIPGGQVEFTTPADTVASGRDIRKGIKSARAARFQPEATVFQGPAAPEAPARPPRI